MMDSITCHVARRLRPRQEDMHAAWVVPSTRSPTPALTKIGKASVDEAPTDEATTDEAMVASVSTPPKHSGALHTSTHPFASFMQALTQPMERNEPHMEETRMYRTGCGCVTTPVLHLHAWVLCCPHSPELICPTSQPHKLRGLKTSEWWRTVPVRSGARCQ